MDILLTILTRTAFTAGLILSVALASSLLARTGRHLFHFIFRGGYETAAIVYMAFTFPGVLMHELSHALLAMLTGARVRSIHFTRTGGETILEPRGNRVFRDIQLSLSAVAPALMGTLAIIGAYYLAMSDMKPLIKGIGWYLLLCAFLHSDLSGQDVKVYLRGLPGLFMLIFLCQAVCLFFTR